MQCLTIIHKGHKTAILNTQFDTVIIIKLCTEARINNVKSIFNFGWWEYGNKNFFLQFSVFSKYLVSSNCAHNGDVIINFSNTTIKNTQCKKIMLNYKPTTQQLLTTKHTLNSYNCSINIILNPVFFT